MIDWNQNHAFDYLDMLLTEEERRAFERDVAANGPCAEYLDQAQKLRSMLEASRLEAQDLDWVAIKNEITNHEHPLGSSNKFSSPWLWAPMLAASVVLLAVFLPLLTEEAPSPIQAPLVGGEIASIPPEETNTNPWQTLADGSKIQLSEDAIWTQISQEDGGIHLALSKGELRAQVVRSPSRPYFRIAAADVTVEVLGTEFIVGWSEEGTIQVDVIHGKVAVSSDGNKVILTDGDTFSHAPKAIPTAENTNPASEEPGMPVLKAEPASPRTTPSDITKKRTSVKKVPVKQSNPVQATKVETPLETDIPVVEADNAKKSGDAPVQTAEVVKIESQPVAPIQNKTKVEIERFKDPVQRSLAEIILEIRKGKLHRALGQLKAHQNAHAGHRNTMDAKYLEGYCLYKLGNKEQAMKIWEHYESRVPNGPWLRTVRDWTSPSVPSLDRLR